MNFVSISRISIFLLVCAGVSALGACGRRGPLEPPPYTQQGKEWERRTGANKQQPRAETPAQGSVREALEDERASAGTVDVEPQLDRKRIDGPPATPTDPTQAAPDQVAPTLTGSRRRPPGIVPPKRSLLIDGLLE
jgi:predicted small lipoprotein YifL